MTSKENHAWGKAHNISVGQGRGDMTPAANQKTRRKALRAKWTKDRQTNETFGAWKRRLFSTGE